MQFAEGTGTGTYRLGIAPSPTNQYFVDPKVPNTTITKSSGAFPQRTFAQGNHVPGIVIASGQTVNSFRCALAASTSGNDVGQITVTLQAETGWTGSTTVALQGGFNRYSNATTNWVQIGSTTATITAAGQSVNLQVTSDQMWPVYRLQAVSTNGAGIIDWSIGNMFPDLSAELVGSNATNTNGSIGQEAIQVNSSIPFGREKSWVGNTGNTGNNQTEIGTMFTPGGML